MILVVLAGVALFVVGIRQQFGGIWRFGRIFLVWGWLFRGFASLRFGLFSARSVLELPFWDLLVCGFSVLRLVCLVVFGFA